MKRRSSYSRPFTPKGAAVASKELVCGGESYKISYEISNLQREKYILILHG